MTLSEAAKLRKGTNKRITRKDDFYKNVYFIPTDGTIYIGVVDKSKVNGDIKSPVKGWMPNEQDLIADDWILID